MKDDKKTKDQVIKELAKLRQRIAELETSEIEHKKAEKALREAIVKAEDERARSEAIIDSIGEGISIQDTNFKILYQNQVHKDIVGDHFGEYCYKAYERNDCICEGCPLARTFEDGKIHTEERRVDLDDRILHVEITASPLKDATGKIIRGIEVVKDIAKRKQIEEELNKLATTDELTQAYNRAKFEELIPIEIERARRFNHPLSLLIFDIDHFKKINDTFGHLFGDYVLKTTADIVREHMRKVNYFIRWGGDEFMIIAIETNFEDAKNLSERIRKAVGGYSFDKANKITVSCGVTQFEEDATLDTFLKRADDALYQAKEKGRNRVEGIV